MEENKTIAEQLAGSQERVRYKADVYVSLTNELTEIESVSCAYAPSLPKASADIVEMALSREKLLCCKAKIAKAKEDHAEAVELQKQIANFAILTRRQMQGASRLAEQGYFDKALAILNAMDDRAEAIDDERLNGIKHEAIEHIAYQKAKLCLLKARKNKQEGLPPLSREESARQLSLVYSLTTADHSESCKQDLLNESILNAAILDCEDETNRIHDETTLRAAIERRDYLCSLCPGMHGKAKDQIEIFSKIIQNEFNELSVLYFDEEPNIDKAVAVYSCRAGVSIDEISHEAYRECEDEKSFRTAFLCQMALRKDSSSYKDTAIVLANKADEGDEDALDLLAHFISLPLIDSTKFDLTLKAIKPLSFQKKIDFLAKAVGLGLDEEKQALLFQLILKTRDGQRKIDLEASAANLVYLDFHLSSRLKADFNSLKEDLLRSPRAHKIVTKTRVADLRVFAGENPSALKQPLGKKLKRTTAKSFDLLKAVFYWFFIIGLPAFACALAYALFYLNDLQKSLGTAIYIVPLGILIILLQIIGLQYFGRDERGSAWFRRALGLSGIAMLMCSSVCFGLPVATYPLAELFRLPLLVLGAFAYLSSVAVYKESNRVWRYILLGLFVLSLAVAVALLVYVMMDGAMVR
ncbi:MAG TPA: hypothetical protein IAC52_01260 [Candidatus Enteromonas pullicola]|uniref:Uncharacterized protein n=1 Tax=Candidatus Alloenteromonas pullicola TaxID=2840784 RepID=A0A9D1LN51_9FIRM|nr:hypothetical protein [Candidatus Enteromonas pullicola]